MEAHAHKVAPGSGSPEGESLVQSVGNQLDDPGDLRGRR